MKLVKPQDLLKINPLMHYLGGEYFAKLLMRLLQFNQINDLYDNISDKKGIDSIDGILEYLDISLDLDENDLKKLPLDGPFITVSNHPYGGIDGILLIKLLSMVRSDHKVIANFLLKKVEPVADYFLAVNPFENNPNAASSVGGLKTAIDHLQNGGVLSFFPAGEVSTTYASSVITDREWLNSALRFIKKANVPVVPIYFHGSNSKLFHLLGRIHPALRTAKLASEVINKQGKTIKVRIGNPISVKDQDRFTDIHQLGRYFRSKTYCLDSGMDIKDFFNYSLKGHPVPQPIVEETPKVAINREIAELRIDHLLFTIKNYTVFCTPSKNIPSLMNELGRLREITFREVGEGTNQSIDIDEFDLYYDQLIIWDDEEQKIVGGYRIGKGREINAQFGSKGFYIQSLFKMKSGFNQTLNQSLELGRSFIVKEYQRKPLPLFLLWKGILYFLLKNPEYRYLLGPVSISNTYSEISKELIIRYVMANFFDYKRASLVKPRNKFKVTTDDPHLNTALETMTPDLHSLDKFIGDIDQYNSGLPVLLKKYLGLNAKIVAFNVDPKFNDCIDGLLILDIFDVPRHTIESLLKELNDTELLSRLFSPDEI